MRRRKRPVQKGKKSRKKHLLYPRVEREKY
jgi:hypothetical protein